MAYIDKTAQRLCRTYSSDSMSEMYDFEGMMKSINPFDHITFYFNDCSYRKSEEELDKDREQHDGRWDPNVPTLDMLSLDKCYSPEFRDMYESRGSYYATMDWPFVIKDPRARYCDTMWHIHMFGPFNDLHINTHIIGAPTFKIEEIKDRKDPSKVIYTLCTVTAGEFKFSFRLNQLTYVEGCHQNAYDRDYPPEY